MANNLGLKLIAVIDLSKLKIFEAQGIKIIRLLGQFPLNIHKEHRHEKGHFKTSSSRGAGFEPHTSEKDIEYHETAKLVSHHLDKIVQSNSNFKHLMIAADSKMLGSIRAALSNQLKKIVSKEIVKDLAHENQARIEQIFFA